MKKLSIQMSLEELSALLELVENQLFRVKFIDSKIPGVKTDPAKVALASSSVAALRTAYNKAKGFQQTASGAA